MSVSSTSASSMMRHPTLALHAVLVALALAACGGDQVTAPVTGILPPPSGPVKIDPTTDPARAQSALIGPSGGTIDLTAANGTRYHFVVPPSAVLAPTPITITPVTSIAGLPLDHGLLGGVEFAPDGLVLLQPATLTIIPAATFDRRELVGFGYRGEGEGFHLQGSADSANTVVLRLTHFSTHGAGLASSPFVDALLQLAPLTPEDRLEMRIAQLIDVARRSSGALDNDAMLDAFRAYYSDPMHGRLVDAAAHGSFEQTRNGFARATAWMRDLELLGLGDRVAPEKAEIARLMEAAVTRLFAEAATACSEQHEFERIPQLIGLARVGELLFDIHLPVMDVLTRCLQFQLHVVVKTDIVGSTEQHIVVDASIPLETSEVAAGRYSGSQAPSLATWTMRGLNMPPNCSFNSTVTHVPPPLQVTGMSFVYPDSGEALPKDVQLSFDFTAAWTGEAVMNCAGVTVPYPVIIQWITRTQAVIEMKGWEMLRGAIYARWSREVTVATPDGATSTSHILLEVLHSPGA